MEMASLSTGQSPNDNNQRHRIPLPTPKPSTQSSVGSIDEGRKKFADFIKDYSARSKDEYVYSGEHYRFLAQFFEQPSQPYPWNMNTGRDTEFVPLYIHSNSAQEDRTEIIGFQTKVKPSSALPFSLPDAQTCHLVFLSGWQSKEWLRYLGAHCGIDPELFRRHLGFLESRKFHDLPALPSSSLNLCSLRIITICDREKPLSPEHVREARKGDQESVQRYLNELRTAQSVGSSIVRRYTVLNETTSAVEQDISFCVQKVKEGGWTGFVWSDSGRGFDDTFTTPWIDRVEDQGAAYDPYLPIIQHRSKMSLNPPDNNDFTHSMPQVSQVSQYSTQSMPTTSPQKRGSQTVSILPKQYGASLDRNLMRTDALYALSELYMLSANSENQFLNLVQAQVESVMRNFIGQEEWVAETLLYIQAHIEEHVRYLQDVLRSLESEQTTGWPRAKEQADIETRDAILRGLIVDFAYLLDKSQSIVAHAIDGTQSIRNDAMLKASQQSITQGKEVGRLTLLAFFFLPMSFVTSFFGMNFLEIKGWKNAVASSVSVFFGVMIASTAVCYWEWMPWRRSRHLLNLRPPT